MSVNTYMSQNSLETILKMIKKLSFDDYETLRLIIQKEGFSLKTELEGFLTENRFKNGRKCVHCHGTHIVKNGHSKEKKQRYLCRECGKTFVISTNSITSGTHKSFDIWMKYLECMMNGFSIRKSATICEIHRETSFAWRHKILDALRQMAESVRLNGIVEADETYFPVSFKGNHSKSSDFSMPHNAHKRGGEVHTPGLSSEQVCVMCAVNDAHVSYSVVGKLGKVSSSCVSKAFDSIICSESTLCTDQEKAYIHYAKDNRLTLIQMDTDRRTAKENMIQRINAYHSGLKNFMSRFHGVSTKYLNNYLTWNNLLFDRKGESASERRNLLFLYASSLEIKIRNKEISQRPVLPMLE